MTGFKSKKNSAIAKFLEDYKLPDTPTARAYLSRVLEEDDDTQGYVADKLNRLGNQQEPVALVIDGVLVKSALPEKYTGHLYTTPPQRPWVGLTDEERQDIALEVPMDAVLITEAKLKEKNNG